MEQNKFFLEDLHYHLLLKVLQKVDFTAATKLLRTCKKIKKTVDKQEQPFFRVPLRRGRLIFGKDERHQKHTVFMKNEFSLAGKWINERIEYISFEHIALGGDTDPGFFRKNLLPELKYVGRFCKELCITSNNIDPWMLEEVVRVTNPHEVIFFKNQYLDDANPVFKDVPSICMKIHNFDKEMNGERILSMLRRRRRELHLAFDSISINLIRDFLRVWKDGGDVGIGRKMKFSIANLNKLKQPIEKEQKYEILEDFDLSLTEEEKEREFSKETSVVLLERDSSFIPSSATVTLEPIHVTILFH